MTTPDPIVIHSVTKNWLGTEVTIHAQNSGRETLTDIWVHLRYRSGAAITGSDIIHLGTLHPGETAKISRVTSGAAFRQIEVERITHRQI